MQSQAAALAGRGQDINDAFGTLPQFVDSGENLLATLNSQSASVRRLVANTGTFFNAISARQGELSGLITAANNLFQTTAQRNQQLADVFRALPNFELQTRLTLPALTSFAQKADPVVRALEPIATELTGTFGTTAKLAPQLHSLFDRLGPTVTASERGLPALDRILGAIPPLLGAFQPWLRNANPIVSYIGLYKREITGFFANVTGASQAHDVELPRTSNEVHYLRTSQTLTPEGSRLPRSPAGPRARRCLPSPGRVLAAGPGPRRIEQRRVLARQPGAADERLPLDARAADQVLRVPHRFPQRRGAAVRPAGTRARLLHRLPAAARRAGAERRRITGRLGVAPLLPPLGGNSTIPLNFSRAGVLYTLSRRSPCPLPTKSEPFGSALPLD